MNYRSIILYLLLFLLGWVGGFIYQKRSAGTEHSIQVRENSSEYRFTNPLLFIDNSEETFEELNPIKRDIEAIVSEKISRGKAERVSVYFRDLNTGKWTGFNEDDLYMPSSMLKVAVLMAYLKLAEENPDIVGEKLLYSENKNNHQHYIPKQLVDGFYRVDKLLGQMVIESDDAATIPLSLAQERRISELYSKLRIQSPKEKLENFVSPRMYSTLFRSLFSSTYLSRSYSEQALELLSRTNFTKGIVAGISKDIPVAHKFGEHSIYYTDTSRTPDYQLHDCGIVYVPLKPYFLCVMTQGKNFSDLESVISNVSSGVWKTIRTLP